MLFIKKKIQNPSISLIFAWRQFHEAKKNVKKSKAQTIGLLNS